MTLYQESGGRRGKPGETPLAGSLECGVWSLEFGVWSLEFGVWNLEFGVQHHLRAPSERVSEKPTSAIKGYKQLRLAAMDGVAVRDEGRIYWSCVNSLRLRCCQI